MLELMAEGRSNGAIASAMVVTEGAVEKQAAESAGTGSWMPGAARDVNA